MAIHPPDICWKNDNQIKYYARGDRSFSSAPPSSLLFSIVRDTFKGKQIRELYRVNLKTSKFLCEIGIIGHPNWLLNIFPLTIDWFWFSNFLTEIFTASEPKTYFISCHNFKEKTCQEYETTKFKNLLILGFTTKAHS